MITGKYPSLRLRRNRKFSWTRRLVRENDLSTNDLIQPIFLTEGKNKKIKISSMSGICRYSIDMLPRVIDKALSNKIPMVSLFPNTPIARKNNYGSEDCIAITRIFIAKIKRLIKLKEDNLIDKNYDTVIAKYKPPIFWKEREIVKIHMQKWSIDAINNLLYELNDLEFTLKMNMENSLNILSDFILSKSKTNN